MQHKKTAGKKSRRSEVGRRDPTFLNQTPRRDATARTLVGNSIWQRNATQQGAGEQRVELQQLQTAGSNVDEKA